MGAVHVHEFMSLDGVIDAPTWTFEYGFDPEMGEAIGAVTGRVARASCSGARPTRCSSRRGRRGPSRTIPGAPFFNDTTKYVVSATLTEATWRNSEIIGPYDPDRDPPPEGRGRRRPLRQRQRHAGPGDARRRLVDELHLFVYPLTRGSGPRLFAEGAAPARFSLADSATYDNGVIYLAYRPQA